MTAHALPVASWRVVLRTVQRLAGRRAGLVAPLAVLLLLGALLGTVPAIALGELVDLVSEGDAEHGDVLLIGAAMAAAVALGAVLDGLGFALTARLLETGLARLRERMVDAAFRLPLSQVERAGTGDVVARSTDDVAKVSEAISDVTPALTSSLFAIVASVIAMTVVDPWFALAFVLIVPVHIFAVRRYLADAPAVYAAERAATSERAQHLLEAVTGLATLRAFAAGDAHAARVARASWSVVRLSVRAVTVQNAFFARLNLAELVGMGSLLCIGFVLVEDGNGTVGSATTAMLLFLRLFDPINSLLFVTDQLQSALASLARIVGVVAASDEKVDGSPARESGGAAVLSLCDVAFGYDPKRLVLHGVSLTASPGETIAVVGASGSGKSTLAGLAAGLHEAAAGTVRRPSGAGETVLMTQEIHVFDGTVRDNLTLARPDAGDAELRAVLDLAGASSLLAALPAGLDTPIGAGGEAIGPADAQLLGLARVMLADPRLVILDEPTAEAGSAQATWLDRATRAVLRDRTGLIVTHRLSQAEEADQIVVLEDGRIVESGTHEQLLAADGDYARLHRAYRRG